MIYHSFWNKLVCVRSLFYPALRSSICSCTFCKCTVFADTWPLSILGISPTVAVTVDRVMTTLYSLPFIPSLAFALFLTFPFHVSVTFPLSACQKPAASGVAVTTGIWRRHIMILSLRSHLFSHHVLVVGQVNCRHYSSVACMIYLYHMSTWCVVNARSRSFLSMIFTQQFFTCV